MDEIDDKFGMDNNRNLCQQGKTNIKKIIAFFIFLILIIIIVVDVNNYRKKLQSTLLNS